MMSRRDAGRAAPRRTRHGPAAVAVAAALAAAVLAFPATPVGEGVARQTAPARQGPALTTRATPSDGTPAVGALFTTTPSGALAVHFCSASVVDSPAGDLVITAAHCMTGRAAGQVVFVPGYAHGNAPYGAWAVTRVIVTSRWEAAADPDDDVAFLVVSQPQSGVAVQRVTGGERLGAGQPPVRLVAVTGYPNDHDTPVSCRNYTQPFGPAQLVFRCAGFTTGTSGGPMLADLDPGTGLGTLIGVIGGYQQGGATDSVSYAARLGAGAAALYQDAVSSA